MKKLLLLILLINVTCLLQGQDIIYTVNCEKNGVNTKLDSIKFENLSNDSHIVFGELQNQTNYAVNLSLQQIETNTGFLDPINEDQTFKIVKNIPGEISIQCKNNLPEDINISILNLSGQKLYSQKINAPLAFYTINIEIPKSGFYIINLHSLSGDQSFKAAGSGHSGPISSSINLTKTETNVLLQKSSSLETESDFSFQQGDSLRVTAYLDGNSTYPIEFTVNESDSLNLFFVEPNESYFIVDNIKHPLDMGYHVCFGDGSGVYIYGLYLTSNISYSSYSWDDSSISLLGSGIGNEIVFNIIGNENHFDITNGQYNIGQGTNDPNHYATNVDIDINWNSIDINNPPSEVVDKYQNYKDKQIEINSGTVTINESEGIFNITFNFTDKDGLQIVGKYIGNLNRVEFHV